VLRSSLFALITLALPVTAHAQCGGGFSNFVSSLKEEAMTGGYDRATVNRFFKGVRQDPAVLKADRAQGVFQKPFVEFSQRLISQGRLDRGRAMSKKYDAIFRRIETTYGIDRGVLLAFWAFETDYGAVQGNFNTLNALVTLAHDCRRPELFRPQVFAALELYSNGDFDPQKTTGAWAGEIGMVQMLPGDIIENGVDGDGDGRVSLKTSAVDALMSGGKMLEHLGWRSGEPWLQEVTVPADMDWSLSGVDTTLDARDWARMGQLWLNKGTLNGTRLMTEDWVAAATTPNTSKNVPAYGYQLWLNRGNPELRWPQLPADAYAMSGNRHQSVMIVPSRQVVLVRLGWTSGRYPMAENYQTILSALATSH